MRLLYIEDHVELHEAVSNCLREEGFVVDSATDGDEGLFLAVENDYDVIVLDVMLPGVDGLEIVRRLRARGDGTPILIISARDKVSQRVEGLHLGADDYLIKPFALDELVARIGVLLRRKYGARDPLIKIEDLEIDTTTKKVRRGTESINLTPREYALLEYLALRSGELVSRTEIWDHIYEYQSSATSNVVDVYVRYLRNKLNAGGHANLIQTRRGFGYVLEASKE
jgi:DNA-binding response OmpR family regulator